VHTPQMTDALFTQALGVELRHAREDKGWSRAELVAKLPSRIGERTLLSYEHGTRQMNLVRMHEICQALAITTPDLLRRAEERALRLLRDVPLRVDLHQLLTDKDEFRLHRWANNALAESADGIAEITPSAVEDIAVLLGIPPRELTAFLCRFSPREQP
jgi:transcriptional regulator with XRE-family HTH domain